MVRCFAICLSDETSHLDCNLNLVKKFEFIEQYKPDIAIIQECEKLDKSYFPNSEYWWIGKDEKKTKNERRVFINYIPYQLNLNIR